MLVQIILSGLMMELDDWQQELLTGGNNPQINNNNFAQRVADTTGSNTTGPSGNVTKTNTQLVDTSSGSQSILSSDTLGLAPLGVNNNMALNGFLPGNNSVAMF
ncbi:CTB family bacteriocin [Cronbergia sp. UHCC 0137]|uniref:CTB family bacteriocin n=1 Tax=Cronbergia sp. UHCC 0137 TaxID=3110239 RepID=UPI002B210BC1|nr:CTB family bacteriocin [Cronbergia sp. UHCC 0137]MEA5618588.1 CTB family bacteriocin [Cronbergia sp. UHCC 0137]